MATNKLVKYLNQTTGEWEGILSGGVQTDDGSQTLTASEIINLRNNNTKPLSVEVRTSDPTSPQIGQIWFRSDL